MYACMYVRMYVCMHVFMHACICIYACMHTCMCVRIFKQVCMYVWIFELGMIVLCVTHINICTKIYLSCVWMCVCLKHRPEINYQFAFPISTNWFKQHYCICPACQRLLFSFHIYKASHISSSQQHMRAGHAVLKNAILLACSSS